MTKQYTDRQKADFYLSKYKSVQFNDVLFAIYWQLYKAYDMADKAKQRLATYRKISKK